MKDTEELLSLIVQSALAVDAIFFGVLALTAALLNESLSRTRAARERLAHVRQEYQGTLQARDYLDPARQAAQATLRDLERDIEAEGARTRLLLAAVAINVALVLLATFVTVYGFRSMDHDGVASALVWAFVALVIAPLLASVALLAWVVKTRETSAKGT